MSDYTKNIVETAMMEEAKAEQFYLDLANQMEDEGARSKFEGMAETELKHFELLLVYYQQQFNEIPNFVEDGKCKIFRPETPSIKASIVDAVKIIMETEQRAYEFYLNAAKSTSNDDARKVFNTLAGMEKGHFKMFEGEFNSLMNNTFKYGSGDIPWKIK